MMNILKQCTFIDRNRNAEIDLDDLLEEKYLHGKRIHKENIFYLLLYFNANWLPDVCNKTLNTKLEIFSEHKKLKNKFEIIFISSDKTRDCYAQFLSENKFIRYSLAFHEIDLKAQLIKYLNINGIPSITILQLKLDRNLKLIDHKIEFSNAKQMILSDENGKMFPWMTSEPLSSHPADIDTIEPDETKPEEPIEIPKIDIETTIDALKVIKSNSVFFNKPTQEDSVPKQDADFLFLVLGANQSKLTNIFLNGLVEFWKQFNVKYKFDVVYFNLQKEIDESILNIVEYVPWFYYKNSDDELKIRLYEFYGIENIKNYPKMLVIDSVTGDLMNQNFKLALLEYVHEFCNKQTEIAKTFKRKTTLTEINDVKFDYSIYDICKFLENSNQNRCNRTKQRTLDKDLLDEISENLIEISTSNTDVEKEEENLNNFYLLYFCSNFTTSNENIFNNIIHFLNSIQEKLNCRVDIVVVSSDQNKEDYIKLLEKIDTKIFNKKKNQNYFNRYALDFNAISVKEKLFEQLKVVGIPWFALINAKNGQILSENLRHLIFNSQLKGVKI